MIEEGHTKDILEAMESSVGLFRMQSMNQSLIALLVHQKITYEDAMALSSDPDDLSLKVAQALPADRRPRARGGRHGSELLRFLADHRVDGHQAPVRRAGSAVASAPGRQGRGIRKSRHDLEISHQELSADQKARRGRMRRSRGSKPTWTRLRADAQAKITQLQERIKELNRTVGAWRGAGGEREEVKVL